MLWFWNSVENQCIQISTAHRGSKSLNPTPIWKHKAGSEGKFRSSSIWNRFVLDLIPSSASSSESVDCCVQLHSWLPPNPSWFWMHFALEFPCIEGELIAKYLWMRYSWWIGAVTAICIFLHSKLPCELPPPCNDLIIPLMSRVNAWTNTPEKFFDRNVWISVRKRRKDTPSQVWRKKNSYQYNKFRTPSSVQRNNNFESRKLSLSSVRALM